MNPDLTNRWVYAGFGLLLLLNLLLIGLLLWNGLHRRPGGPRNRDRIAEAMHWSAQQQQQHQALKAGYFKETQPLRDSITALKAQLFASINSPDSALSHPVATRIGVLEGRIEWLTYRHFQAISRIATPEQRQRLSNLIQEMTRHYGPHAGPRNDGPHGPPREGQPFF